MSVAVLDLVWKRSEAKGSDLLVLLAIADNANEETAWANPGYDYLAAKTRLSKRNVQYCVRRLVEMPDEERELTLLRKGARGRSNEYRVEVQTLRRKLCVVTEFRRNLASNTVQPVATEPSGTVEAEGTSYLPHAAELVGEVDEATVRAAEEHVRQTGQPIVVNARPKNPVWDAVAALFGAPTTPNKARTRGRVVADLRAAGCETEEDVRALADEYRRTFSTKIAITPHALARHAEQLRKQLEAKGGQGGSDLSIYDDAA